jgi:hypothetical protein
MDFTDPKATGMYPIDGNWAMRKLTDLISCAQETGMRQTIGFLVEGHMNPK